MEDERLSQGVKLLKEWYEKQPHLPKGISEVYFLTFANGCKTLEDAKRKLDAFFSLRHEQVWYNDFENLFARLKKEPIGELSMLPGLTPEGWRVWILSYHRVDINKTDHLVDGFNLMLSVEYTIRYLPKDVSQVLIYDFKGAGITYFAKMSLPFEIAVAKFLQLAMPLRVKKMLMINTIPAVETTMNMLRPFLPKKINDRTVISSTTQPLRECLPDSMIPKEYGGNGASLEELGKSWMKTVLAHEDWFRDNSQLRSDERKRPPVSEQTLEAGSFRTLSID